MKRTLTRSGTLTGASLLVAALVLMSSGTAQADNIQDSIGDDGSSVALVAGSATTGSASIRLIGTGGDVDAGCNIDAGEGPLKLDILTPTGVTASPNPVSITSCGTFFPVTFTALSTAVNGTVTVTLNSVPAGGGTYMNQVSIPITITQPVPTNTPPTVSVGGVTNGTSYEIGSVPSAFCNVVDTQDGNSSFAAPLTGTLSHGLGTQTATCNYTDGGGLAAITATASYTIVDTGVPTISHILDPNGPNGENGWYTSWVLVDFNCADGGSGIQSCVGDTTLGDGANQSATGTATDWAGNSASDTGSGISVDTIVPTISHILDPTGTNGENGWYTSDVDLSFSCSDGGSGIQSCIGDVTVGEGADQSATGTATDVAGNTTSETVSGLNVDKTNPTVGFSSGPSSSGSYYYGSVPAAPTCDGTDALSGLASCVITGGGTTVGEHSYRATATDNAGNTSTATLDYTVRAWNLHGFYSPVDMGATVWNTVKGGSTVPLKFEVFAGATEFTTTSAVKSFTATTVACPGAGAALDAIEFTTTGGTTLRYDSTGGHFIQNWATPKKPGTCVKVTMTTQDDSSITANFLLR